jgi:hypothetical protein
VPACVLPNHESKIFLPSASSFSHELLATPREELLGRYRAHGPSIYKPQLPLIKLRQVESVVAGDGLRLGIVLGDRLLDEAQRLSFFAPATLKVGKASRDSTSIRPRNLPRPSVRVPLGHAHQSVASPFFLSYRGSGEVIQRLARCQSAPPEGVPKSSPDGFARDLPLCEALLEGNLCCHL